MSAVAARVAAWLASWLVSATHAAHLTWELAGGAVLVGLCWWGARGSNPEPTD